METHTPEIWHNTGLEIRNQAGMIIATVYKHLEANQSKETAISNAELIARAPVMQNILIEEITYLKEWIKEIEGHNLLKSQMKERIEFIEMVINK